MTMTQRFPRVPALLLLTALVGSTGCPQQRTQVAGASAPAPAGAAADASPDAPVEPFEPLYPAEIHPPAGTQYPCALTALPPGLPGIPAADQRFIDHVYTQLLAAIHAKLQMFQELRTGDPAAMERGLAAYQAATNEALAAIQAEAIPRGLEGFQAQVSDAIRLQQTFFAAATQKLQASVAAGAARSKASWEQAWQAMFAVPEGRQASSKLMAAWGQMQARYPQWPAATKDSIYHHLCALDLF
ncbi:MAG: hypothetical protein AB7N76_06305 [Planctomycetota bacterium]